MFIMSCKYFDFKYSWNWSFRHHHTTSPHLWKAGEKEMGRLFLTWTLLGISGCSETLSNNENLKIAVIAPLPIQYWWKCTLKLRSDIRLTSVFHTAASLFNCFRQEMLGLQQQHLEECGSSCTFWVVAWGVSVGMCYLSWWNWVSHPLPT